MRWVTWAIFMWNPNHELWVGNGNQNVKLTEWGRMNLNMVYMGETRLVWLLKMMNELVSETTGISACRDHRMGGLVMFLQKRMNRYGKFMEITEYGRGGRCSFVVIPEGCEGQGWKHCILQMGQLVKYLNQVRDTTMKKLPIQLRVVILGRTFAEVEGKRSETKTKTRGEGKMGILEEVINMVTFEKSKKGKERIMKPENQVVSKWEELVALVDEGVMNMKLMKDILEAFKGKMEIYAQKCGMGCVDEGKSPMEIKQGNSGANNQVGPADYLGSRAIRRLTTGRGIGQWLCGDRRGGCDVHNKSCRCHRRSIDLVCKSRA